MFRQWNTGTDLNDYRDVRREKLKRRVQKRVNLDVPSCLMILTGSLPWLYHAVLEVLKSFSVL